MLGHFHTNHSKCLAEARAHVGGILTLQVPELKVRGTLKVEDLHLPTRSFSHAPKQGGNFRNGGFCRDVERGRERERGRII